MYKLQSLKIKNIISFKEAEFEFRNGKAIIIVGKNLDDGAQQGNGSGKSSLIESIALAFTGCSIRDVKTKELIYNGEDHGTIELTLLNTDTKQTFIIWRKLYANTKSAEYAANINGVDQSNRYSDFNMFNQFVWDTIGISKEDFFSFFLITKDNYQPFLTIGDKDKKEIINRFSGADKVDNVFPEIQTDCDVLDKEVRTLENQLLQNKTKQEVLTGQLAEEENKTSEEVKNQLIESKLSEVEALMMDSSFEQAVKEADKTLTSVKAELADFESQDSVSLTLSKEAVQAAQTLVNNFKFTKEYDVLLSEVQATKNKIDLDIISKKSELSKVSEQFKPEVDSIKNDETLAVKTRNETQASIQEYETFESEVNKQLLDAITCPKCSHVFSLNNKDFNAEEAKAELPVVQEELKKLKKQLADQNNFLYVDIPAKKQEISERVQQAGETIRTAIAVLNNELVEAGNQMLTLKKEQQEELNNKQQLINKLNVAKNQLQQKEHELSTQKQTLQNNIKRAELVLKQKQDALAAHNQSIEALEAYILKLQDQEIDRTALEKLRNDIQVLKNAESEIETRLEEKRKEKESVSAWEFHFKNFKSHLANKSIKNIADYTNLFLQNMGSNLSINIDGYKTLSNKKIKEQIYTEVYRDGFNAGSYGKFSGGERGRIDICSIIAMQELILLNSKGGIDLLVADEILDQVDTLGLESIINSLQSLQKTIMIVSQNEINTLADYTLTIQKQNKVSTILN